MLGIIGWAGIIAVVGAGTGRDAAFAPARECAGGSFTTCASVRGSVVGRDVALTLPARFGARGDASVAFRMGDGGASGLLPSGLEAGIKVFCPAAGRSMGVEDCALLSGPGNITVTPEPISMALVATGLVGMAAARRRKQRSVDQSNG